MLDCECEFCILKVEGHLVWLEWITTLIIHDPGTGQNQGSAYFAVSEIDEGVWKGGSQRRGCGVGNA